jgi:hypothetical protein
MTQLTTTRFVGGVGAGVSDLQMERDLEGVVLQHRYAKASGKAGDWFQLDGWDRLQEAKLGVASFAGTYASAGFDKKVAYALDAVHNRQQVDETVGSSTATTTYQRRGGTNEYAQVSDASGTQSWLYCGKR